jgi:hypothetical protein
MRLRKMDPDVLVSVQYLLLGAGPSVENVGEVECIAGAGRSQHGIADRQVDWMGKDLGGEDPGLGCHPGYVPGARTEEPRNGVVHELAAGRIGGGH